MPFLWILLTILAIAIIGYFVGRRRAMSFADGDARKLHSLPRYYGLNVALSGLIPALIALFLWTILQPSLIQTSVSSLIDAENAGALNLAMADVQRVANGLDTAVAQGAMTADVARNLDVETTDIRGALADVGVALGSAVTEETLSAAQAYRDQDSFWRLAKTIVALGLSFAGTAYAFTRINTAFRARNFVERVILAVLIGAASLAVLTTVGIVLSLIFNTIEFFRLYPFADFFYALYFLHRLVGCCAHRPICCDLPQ